VDQPKGDVFNQSNFRNSTIFLNDKKYMFFLLFYKVIDFTIRPARSYAPITPRILLIGPYGSGRRTQANALSKKYDIVNGMLII
jgi:hypothetical protein